MGRTLGEIRASSPDVDEARLAATTEADIRQHMIEDGEDPEAEPGPYKLVIPPAFLREQLGMDAEEFAAALDIPLDTLRDWESGRSAPDPGARSLLAAVRRDPQTVFRLIAGKAAA